MKKVFRFVKGKKDERKESAAIPSSHSGDLVSPARTPEDERFLGLDNSSGYTVDFCSKDRTLTKLHKAAWQGNLEKLKSALKKVEVDAGDRHYRTALHFAVAQGHPNIVWFLLGSNANISVCDDEGHTPLLKAIECGHRECMSLLLERGADVNVADYKGNTGLHVAIAQASFETVSALLEKGAETEVSNNAGDYPLHIATRLESKDLVDLLLRARASVDVLDRENRTPLMLAAKTGNNPLVQLFVEHNAQLTIVDSNGWTAQDYAMLGGHENVVTFLKSFLKNKEKNTGKKSEESEMTLNDNGESWGDNSLADTSEQEPVTQKVKKCFDKGEKCADKEESPDSPDAESMPPYCQPPRSWEMIQAGMIDENKNGHEPKRRIITTLGTLHSRRESFTEGSTSSPQFTLSLNRRKGAKEENAFAKQRFSFNEKESLRYWIGEEKTIRKDLEKTELKNILNLEKLVDPGKRSSDSETDWDSISAENTQDFKKAFRQEYENANSKTLHESNGNLGRKETMHEAEEILEANSQLEFSPKAEEHLLNSLESEDASSQKETSFPPPPTALELGVDMAKSIKYMKGMSVDQPSGCEIDKNLWKNFYESHSLNRLEEKDFEEIFEVKAQGKCRSGSAPKSQEISKCQNRRDSFTDVSRRINEQLECYDQALRELAETSKNCSGFPSQNYYSLPSAKTGGGGERRRASSQEFALNASSLLLENGPHSLPLCETQWGVENNERLGFEYPTEKFQKEISLKKPEENLRKKSRRHMLLAMRDIKHAVHAAGVIKTSVDDQILSPLTRPDGNFDLDEKSSPKGLSSSSEGNSPFFDMGRQETVLERKDVGRKSSSSGTGEEPTLWLQDDGQKKETPNAISDDDISDIVADERSNHKRISCFSPLGIIQREMEEESKFLELRTAEGLASEKVLHGETEEQNEEILCDQSPDVSLSSGPIEPIGAEKDSGSEPESSHCDVSPVHSYALKSQHEWLKCHLKAATSEKSKLEELTARLAEKAERLQYELADAKEAAKSRDEVIRLLQGQLSRMEAAYTKSLEESVQSRLRLSSHEQEILHLKELCYGYEEEKEAAGTGGSGDFLQKLQKRIKILEEEKEKMKKDIIRLEEEKSILEKRLEQNKNKESEMLDQCQRWKERCGKLEEMARGYDSKQAAYESYVNEKNRELLEKENKFKQQSFQFETKFFELKEENIELRTKIRCLAGELQTARRKATAKNEKHEYISELKKKNCELEMRFKNLEKEMEEKMIKKQKEKEEVEDLMKQFKREKDSLVASYENKLKEGGSDRIVDEWKRENQRLNQAVKYLQEHIAELQMSRSVKDFRTMLKTRIHQLEDEWEVASGSRAETHRDPRWLNALATGSLAGGIQEIFESEEVSRKERAEGERKLRGPSMENTKPETEILQLKSQVNSLRMVLDSKRWSSIGARNQKNFEKKFDQKSELKRKVVDKEDKLFWSDFYAMNASRRRRSRRTKSAAEELMNDCDAEEISDEKITENKKQKPSKILDQLNAAVDSAVEGETEINKKFQNLEFLKLKKEILSLKNKMMNEKNFRHALENQIIKLNLDLSGKINLKKEIRSLKKKIDGDCLRRSEMELLEYQKELEAQRNKYLEEAKRKDTNDDFKTKCEALAREKEKSATIRNLFDKRVKIFDYPFPEDSYQMSFDSCFRFRPHAELLPKQPSVALDPDLKNKLEYELDKSIRKYVLDFSCASTAPNVGIGILRKKRIKKI